MHSLVPAPAGLYVTWEGCPTNIPVFFVDRGDDGKFEPVVVSGGELRRAQDVWPDCWVRVDPSAFPLCRLGGDE